VYPDARVVAFINQHFVPVRVHVKDNADAFQQLGGRFKVQWTPTTLLIDTDGTEQHRIEGFLPAPDFLSQLSLGVAKAAFARKDYAIAAPLFRQVVDEFPSSESAPEALYWAGVSQYRATNDPTALRDTSQAFRERYRDTSWAKKASVWQ
jgi:hypothetical protein